MITLEQIRQELAKSEATIGTDAYDGIAYFWSYAYRHYLRNASPYRRRLVHKHLLKAGLDVAGESGHHWLIISKYVGD